VGKYTVDNTILIVDDSPYIVDGLVALLKRKGFKTMAANGGDQALSLLTTATPDLILLDIMMEPVDGWETLDRIKQNPATKDIPVLMFSAKKISPGEAEEHSLKIEDFISKPVNPVQLLESIQQIFTRRSNVKIEASVAKEAGFENGLIDEYTSLRKSIEVDRNMLVVLKNSSGMNAPGIEAVPETVASIQKLEEKICTDEQRLKEINEKFHKKD
jgi:CheY-like chemotaxis protein